MTNYSELNFSWPHIAVECTGYELSDIRESCLKLSECLVDKNHIKDVHRCKLKAVVNRYAIQFQ